MFEQIKIERECIGGGEHMLVQGDGSKPQQVLAEHAGLAQAVYIDPPFMTGDTFVRRRRFGAKGWRTGSPSLEYPSYSDDYETRDAYLAMLRGLIENAWMLLSNSGMLCLHLDWRSAARARIICDEIFGEDRFVNEIIWAYESGGRARRYFSRKHDVILMYAKSRNYRFEVRNVPLVRGETRKNHLKKNIDENGRAYRSIFTAGKEYRYYDDEPVYPGDVWTDISHLQQRDPERTGFMTQKPMKLLDRLLRPLVHPGDLVCDLCCGSGTTMAAAAALGCRTLGMDVSPEALLTSMVRLNSDNVSLVCPCSDDPVPLPGEYDPESGLLRLDGFQATHPSFPETQDALDPLERWSCGFLLDGVLHVQQTYQRTPKHPELEAMTIVTPAEGRLAISTVDAAGRRRVYQWREE